jgi:hypothetical protein
VTMPPQTQQATEHFIYDTTQSQFGSDLRVGTGNIWEEEYIDEDGTSTTGLTAGLWFFVRDHPELDQHIRVHRGQRIKIADYQIAVIEVEQDGVRISLIPPGDK